MIFASEELEHFRGQGRLNISQWVTPRPHETVHGFFLRLADEHLCMSAGSFADALDIDVTWGNPQALLEAVLASDFCSDADRAALIAWTARIEGAYAFICWERVARDDFSLRTRRFCPGCLAESAHHRGWFDLQFMARCPLHGAAIVDEIDGSFKANWLHPQIATLATGEELAKPLPRVKELPASLESYVLGRFGIVPKTAHPLLDDHALNEVVGAAETIGRLAVGGHMDAMPAVGSSGFERDIILAEGFKVLREGRQALKIFLEGVAAKAPAMAYGTDALFGCAYGYMSPRMSALSNPIELTAFELMKEIARDLGRRGRHHTDPKPSSKSTFVTISELAEEVGRTPNAVFLAARALGFIEPHPGIKGYPHLIARRQVEQVREVMDRTLTREEAAEYLAVEVEIFDQIVLSRHLEKAGVGWSETGRNCDMYDRLELERFLDSIPLASGQLPPTASNRPDPHGLVDLPSLFAQTAYDAGGFFGEVFEGQLTVFTRTDRTRGLASFWFAPMQQPWDHHFTARCRSLQVTRSVQRYGDGMSIALAAGILEVSQGTIKALLDNGLIHQVDRKGGTKRNSLDKLSVFSLAGRFLAAKFYGEALDCPPQTVTRRAAELGIAPLFPTSDRTWRVAPIFDRRVMRDALGLAFDPDQGDVAREGWKEMAERLDDANSLFSLIAIHDDFSATFCTSDADWPIRISYDFAEPIPSFGEECEIAYTIRADFEIKGKKARKRIGDLEAVIRTRALHPLVEAEVDRQHDICRATTKAHILNRRAYNSSGRDAVALWAADDAKVVNRLMTLIKASLEVGPRPYDPRMFGPPTPFYYRA